ncbi:MAG: transcription-repair coupling factor [Candidatus Schekmanbacteria bacterium]|nr:transcription-repair coupling factor [Candidatus Schekmanbacteria bacterium]
MTLLRSNPARTVARLLELCARTPAYSSVVAQLEAGETDLSVHGTWGLFSALVIDSLRRRSTAPMLVVCATEAATSLLLRNLSTLAQPQSAPTDTEDGNPRYRPNELIDEAGGAPKIYASFPSTDVLPYDELPPSMDRIGQRHKVLHGLATGRQPAVVASVDALLSRVLPRDLLASSVIDLELFQEIDRDDLLGRLHRLGYRRTAMVHDPGEMALRGGIVDIFPAGARNPLRLELFGDQLESLREFDIGSQRSLVTLMHARVFPTRDIVYVPELKKEARRNLLRLARNEGRDPAAIEPIQERFDRMEYFPGIERYFSVLCPASATLFNYLADESTIVVCDWDRVRKRLQEQDEVVARESQAVRSEGALVPGPAELFMDAAELAAQLESRRTIRTTLFDLERDRRAHHVTCDLRSVPVYKGKLDTLLALLPEKLAAGRTVFLLANAQAELNLLSERLREPAMRELLPDEMLGDRLVIDLLDLTEGVEIPDADAVIITERELFGEHEPQRRRRRPSPEALLQQLNELHPNDYAVHVDHGIGRYEGLVELCVDGIREDYVLLRYADNHKLYVPVDKLELIKRYRSAEAGAEIQLDRLGGKNWGKTKSKVRKELRDLAEELLRTSARRAAATGFAFDEDDHLQRELEATFPYRETRDQLAAIEDVKADLMSLKPMDRLVCGDAGFGKTEVALRAAFKVASQGKQVAFICPTTILAQQHYETLTERFASFPMRIALLSRFQSPGELRSAVRDLAAGNVDIAVGTHRLLQADVSFRSLGLVVIDEEHRFGVGHKEKLKQLRATVDVLALTATPIPRTLHMSLLGLRDISVIQTPPADRLPIHTRIAEFSPELVREATMAELDRAGQVFFVHNRVQSIDAVAAYLGRLIPEAKIAVAHGQMRSADLERVMLEFYRRRHNVLVCTSIIESGLDVPLANTILINRADRFGLAQLYQLRGRVGREKRKAYAYLLVSGHDALTEVSQKRLKAIQEHTEAGSGFRIASQDLEIRGGGALLGHEQSGHVDEVGYEMYLELIQDAVREVRGEVAEERLEPTVKLSESAFLPSTYIPEMSARLSAYRELGGTRTDAELAETVAALEDRYGKLPPEACALVAVVRLKNLARELKILKVEQAGGTIGLQFSGAAARLSLTLAEKDPRLPLGEQVWELVASAAARGDIPPPG